MENILSGFRVPEKLEKIPGPRGSELLQWGRMVQKDSLNSFVKLQKKYGDYVACPWPNRMSLFVFDPAGVKRILKDNQTNYGKGDEYRHMKPLLGEGVLTSEGELWRRQRRIVAKEFHQSRIQIYQSIVESELEKLIASWHLGELFDVNEGLTDFTFRVAGRIFFGIELEDQSGKAKNALDVETRIANKRMRRAFNIPRVIPTPENVKGNRAANYLKTIVEEVIASGQADDNVLGRLAGFKNEKGEGMQSSLIRDEVMTLLLAGHETTSNALSWTLYLLSLNPKWQDEIRKDQTGQVARACFLEGIRLYPPAPVIARRTLEEDFLGGYPVPKNISVMAIQYVTHRDNRYWENASEFKPERFFNDNIPQDGSYFPFAMGPRACIGESLAMMEGEIALQQLVNTFQFTLNEFFAPKPVHHITLRSENGMWLKLKKI